MNVPPPPPKPPFNDALYRALEPFSQIQSDKTRIEQIMRKYGQPQPEKIKPSRPIQWTGDNNG